MSVKTKIYIIRHGESVGNRDRICLGHTDLPLTELGLAQAKRAADALKDIPFCAIYSSSLIRAIQTAEPHAAIRGMSVIPVDNLKELYFGEWENISVDYLERECSEMFFGPWREGFGTFVAPDGEAVQDMALRAYDAVLNIAKRHPGESVLIVTHAAVLRALWGKICGIEPERLASSYPFARNGSYSLIEYDGARLLPLCYSVDDYIGELNTPLPC